MGDLKKQAAALVTKLRKAARERSAVLIHESELAALEWLLRDYARQQWQVTHLRSLPARAGRANRGRKLSEAAKAQRAQAASQPRQGVTDAVLDDAARMRRSGDSWRQVSAALGVPVSTLQRGLAKRRASE